MTLVGFKARNHPQQSRNPAVDDRAITPEDFDPLHRTFKFTIDAAASPVNARLPRFWTIDDDALLQDWTMERVWCNPPYSNIEPFVAKAHDAFDEGCALIVMLLPANRTEQGWWQRQVEHQRHHLEGFSTRFLPGRMRFLAPGVDVIKPNERPPFGCCLLVWQRQ